MMELPAMYTPEQLLEIQNFIKANFGSNETDYISHELESKYVHSDVLIVDNQADLKLLQNNRADFVEADCKAICKYFGIEYNKKVQEQPKKDTQFKPYLARCTVDNLNCRKGAGTSYGIETQINKGVAITIVEEKMNGSTKWGKSLSGYWVALKYMQFIRFI